MSEFTTVLLEEDEVLLQLWRKEPAMMVPDSLGYRPETQRVDLADL